MTLLNELFEKAGIKKKVAQHKLRHANIMGLLEKHVKSVDIQRCSGMKTLPPSTLTFRPGGSD